MLDTLAARRSQYQLDKDLPIEASEVIDLITRTVELVPDAFNMRSQRVAVALGAKQDELWDAVYDAFGGKVARERIDGFKAAAGTVLYFVDQSVVESLQAQYAMYAQNFPTWAQQANGMLQFSVWNVLREAGVGANIQHYNPVIDDAVRDLFDLPESWVLVAQMPFGGIAGDPQPKDGEDISLRVKVMQ